MTEKQNNARLLHCACLIGRQVRNDDRFLPAAGRATFTFVGTSQTETDN